MGNENKNNQMTILDVVNVLNEKCAELNGIINILYLVGDNPRDLDDSDAIFVIAKCLFDIYDNIHPLSDVLMKK